MSAQQQINGKIFSSATDTVISSATIYNKNLKALASARSDGSYNIAAKENDTIIFSATGFIPDTVKVQFYMLVTQFNISLEQKMITLETARVVSDYREDSLERRNYYQKIFARQPGLTGFNAPEKGFGIVFSPIGFFSKDARQKRVLKKHLLKQEKDDYIDRSFPAEWVSKLTGLSADSLALFMYRYRPSYKFCRKTNRQGMLFYVSDRLKEFRKNGSK